NAIFWPQPATDTAQPGPLLALETDIAAAVAAPGEIGFRVLLANTVDSLNPALTSNYPPAPQALDAGQFGRWPNPPFKYGDCSKGRLVN
ncbi:MAG TPA: hypothetical protein VGN04_03055, partial [Herbaspirillum sp.]